jgi:DNA repair protein RadC
MENIINEIELKYSPDKRYSKHKVTSPEKTYETLLAIWNKDSINLYEEFKVLYLNRSNGIIGVCTHSKGGITGTIADVRLIIGMALKCAACGIVLAHNHPSGNLQPSQSDIYLTRKIKECCGLFDIELMDHVILTSEGFYSFRENDTI